MNRDDEILLVAEQALDPPETVRASLVGTLEVDAESYGTGALVLTQSRVVFVRLDGSCFGFPLNGLGAANAASSGRVLQFTANGKLCRLGEITKGLAADFLSLISSRPSPIVRPPRTAAARRSARGISCPNCRERTPQAGFPAWQIVVAVCFFPLGLLALLAGRDPTTCQHCDYIFRA